MPSDGRIQIALRALSARRSVYRASIASSLSRGRALLVGNDGTDRARMELGAFGSTRINVSRFADLSRGVSLDVLTRSRIEWAIKILEIATAAGDEEFVVHVLEGSTPHAAIDSALNRWGRAFGAALVVDLVRTGQYAPLEHDVLTRLWSFERWGRAHRLAAPPLVVVVRGSGLRVADLHEFLDGAMHIALVVDGMCPPAALVRHVTPGTLVLQTSDGRGVDRFAAYEGPAIAAFVPEGSAGFIHDPDAGSSPWQRLTVWEQPVDRGRITVAGISGAQQRQEVLQLNALAAQPSLPAVTIEALGSAGVGDATDRLASWLLASSGLSDPA